MGFLFYCGIIGRTMTPELKNVLVLNPARDVVTLRPQEILEVVFTGQKNVKWNNRFAHDPARLQLKSLRQETFHCDGFERPRRTNFKVRHLSKHLNVWQHHFWFRFSPLDVQKLEKIKGEPYDLAHLAFTGPEGNSLGSVKVQLLFEEEDKEAYWELLTQTSFKNIDPVMKEAQYAGIGGRIVKLDDGYLFNPSSEQLIFEVNQNTMMVEFAEPTGSLRSHVRWKAQQAPHSKWNDLAVSELPHRNISGTTIQRFLVQNLCDGLGVGVTNKRLGKILFTVEDDNRSRFVKFDRTLDVIVTHKRELGQEFYSGDSGDEDDGRAIEREEYDDYQKTLFLDEIVQRMDRQWKPEKQKVTFEELDSDLETGTKTVKLSELSRSGRKRLEIYDPKDLDSVSLPDNYELVVTLPCSPQRRWGVEIKGKFLKMDLILPDGNRQRFVFTPKPKDEHKQDTDEIIFHIGRQTKRLFVRKWVNRIPEWEDVDRYPD